MTRKKVMLTIVTAALLCTATAFAQVDTRVQPGTPMKPGEALPSDATQPATDTMTVEQVQQQQVRTEADSVPLTGAAYVGLGEMGAAHSFFAPGFRFATLADTDPGNNPGKSRVTSGNYVMGEMALQRLWGRYETRLQYNGGGAFYVPNGSKLDTSFHEFGFAQTINWRRVSVLLADDFNYLPYSSFGFGAIVGMGNFASVLPTYRPQFMPGDTIITGRAPRIGNTALAEMDFQVSRRSTITLTGGYGLLHFMDAVDSNGTPLISGNQTNAVAGYEYTLTRRDTVGLTYGLTMFRFDNGIRRTVDDHVAQVAWAHRITGRMAFEVAAGPRRNIIHDPKLPDDAKWMMGGSAMLHYRWQRAEMQVQYLRRTAMGSGLFVGTENQLAQVIYKRNFTRNWAGNFNAGYSHDSPLHRQLVVKIPHGFDSGFVGGSLERKLGNYSNMYLSYAFQRRTDQCVTGFCATFPSRHVIGVGFDWGFKPVKLD